VPLVRKYVALGSDGKIPITMIGTGSSSNKFLRGDGTWQEISGVLSSPPTNMYKVTNLYVDSVTGKLVVLYDNTPV